LSVEHIAQRCGFASRSHFSKAFKAHTGRSPVEFRSH
jgi:AraC-like DNA-binding protein